MTLSFWARRKVLVTGHTGFKGAWLTLWLQSLGANVSGLALPPEDRDGAFVSMGPWAGVDSRFADLRDQREVLEVFRSVDPYVVLHLGAQALVRRGFADPFHTYAVNVLGTANVLHATAVAPSLRAVVIVTSDKVYSQTRGVSSTPFVEADALGGDDPYSGSKALSELLVRSFRQSPLGDSRVAVATARAGNVIGGGDRGKDRLLADTWRALEAGRPLSLRYPNAVRPWQFVLEPLYGYLLLAERLVTRRGPIPEAVNFGPDPTARTTVAQVVERAFALWGSGSWRREDRPQPPEAPSLRLDPSLARTTLQWEPKLGLEDALDWTVQWWRSHLKGEDLRELALEQVSAYEQLIEG